MVGMVSSTYLLGSQPTSAKIGMEMLQDIHMKWWVRIIKTDIVRKTLYLSLRKFRRAFWKEQTF